MLFATKLEMHISKKSLQEQINLDSVTNYFRIKNKKAEE
jgi:hypothetical protein